MLFLHNFPIIFFFSFYLQSGVPCQILQCADILGLEDTRKPVLLLSKMISYKALAKHLVENEMLEAARMRRLLDGSCPREVILDMLMIVSNLARLHVVSSLTIIENCLHLYVC